MMQMYHQKCQGEQGVPIKVLDLLSDLMYSFIYLFFQIRLLMVENIIFLIYCIYLIYTHTHIYRQKLDLIDLGPTNFSSTPLEDVLMTQEGLIPSQGAQ